MKWISVKESVPEKGKRVLIYDPTHYSDKIQIAAYIGANEYGERFFEGESMDYAGSNDLHIPSHWMPLPYYPDMQVIPRDKFRWILEV